MFYLNVNGFTTPSPVQIHRFRSGRQLRDLELGLNLQATNLYFKTPSYFVNLYSYFVIHPAAIPSQF